MVEDVLKGEAGKGALELAGRSLVEADASPRGIVKLPKLLSVPLAIAAAALLPLCGRSLNGAGVSGRLASGGGI